MPPARARAVVASPEDVERVAEGPHDDRIETRAGAPLDLGARLGERIDAPVRPFAHERAEGVDDAHDARLDGDLDPGEPVGIAAPVVVS